MNKKLLYIFLSILLSLNATTYAQTCPSTEYYGVSSVGYADAVVVGINTTNAVQSLGEPVLVVSSNSYYTKIDKFELEPEYLVLDLTDVIPAGGTISIYWGGDDANQADMEVEGTLTGTDYVSGTDFFDTQTFSVTGADLNDANPTQVIATYNVTQDTRYLRFTMLVGKPGINGVSYNLYACLNAIPTATDDDFQAYSNITNNIDVQANDVDPQGLPLTTTIVTGPTSGTAIVLANGSIDYTPTTGFTGADTITYQVCNTYNGGLCDTATVNIFVGSADLSLTKAVDIAFPKEGEQIEYTLTLTNNGPNTATGIVVNDLLPAGVTFDFNSGGSYNDSTGDWTISSMASGGTSILNISAIVDAGTLGTTISNTATITAADQIDDITSNNSASADITVSQVDLQITKLTSSATPVEGNIIRYTVNVKNFGPSDATGVKILDLLPAGVTFSVINSIGSGTYDEVTGIWDIGTITSGTTYNLKIDVQVDAGTAATSIDNTASLLEVDQSDTNAANNEFTVTITVVGSDLEVVKTVDNVSPSPGDTIEFTIQVTNNGPDKANNITINDDLPAGLTYVSSSFVGGNGDPYTPGNGEWYVNDLDAGLSATLTIIATVDAGTLGQTIQNTASVLSVVELDGITENNSSSVDVYVLEGELSINKIVSNLTPNEGDLVTYTITYTNNSIYNVPLVEIKDLLPASVTYQSDTSTNGDYDEITGIYTIGVMPANTSGMFDIVVQVNNNTGGVLIENTANISSPVFDPNLANNTDSASSQVKGADLAVTKTVNNENAAEGDTVIYIVTLTNNGPDSATNVLVQDAIPNNIEGLSITPTKGTYSIVTKYWDVGTMADGEIQTLTISGILTRPGTFINTAIASADEADGNTSNNTASVTVNSFHSFDAGACIIDMGVVPQTINNGLKPYGLIYDLIAQYQIPIYWLIDSEKNWSSTATGTTVSTASKVDQVDVVINGKSYKGGPYVIPAEFIDLVVPHPDGVSADITVKQVIAYWVSQYPGLTVDCDLPAFVSPLHDIITSFPNAVLDTQNGDKIEDAFYIKSRLYAGQYYDASKDPSNNPAYDINSPSFNAALYNEQHNAYRTASPIELTVCDDMFAMPHADPHSWTLAEKLHLRDWVVDGGYLWMACHAVSSMEGSLMDLPLADDPDDMDMNFLTNNGLVLWGDHGGPEPPFDYSLEAGIFNDFVASDPLMQFIGTVDFALSGGSEQIYIVNQEGYRPTTVFPVRNLNHSETQLGAEFYPGPAASVVYGRAFGNPTSGLVMYEASHTIQGGSVPENVAAARIYGNMLLQGGLERKPQIIENQAIPSELCSNESVDISFDTSGSSAPFTYLWEASCSNSNGSFSILDQEATTFTAPTVTETTTCMITFYVRDGCGRETFFSRGITIHPDPIPSIIGDLDVCVGAQETYTTETGMSDYVWTVTGGTIVSGGAITDTSITIDWNTLGTSNIALTYTDTTTTCTGGNSEDVIVNPFPPAPTFTTNPVEYCVGDTATALTANATGTLTWYDIDGTTVLASAPIPSTTTAGNTTYFATQTENDCESIQAPITVTVISSPYAGIDGTLEVCAGTIPSDAELFDALTGNPDTGGSWSNLNLVYTYTVTATAPCTGTDTATVTLTEQALPNAGALSGTRQICLNETTTFTSDGDPGGTWSSSNNNIATVDGNGVITTVATGSAIITYEVTATAPCTVNAIATKEVVIDPLPFLNPTDVECDPDLTTYTVLFTSNGKKITTSAGDVSGDSVINIPTGVNVVITAEISGCFTSVNITAPDCSCPFITPPISGGDRVYCASETIPTLAATTSGSTSVNWYDASTGGVLLLGDSKVYTPTGPGTYYAEAINTVSGCIGIPRTEVKLTLFNAPTPTSQTICSGDTPAVMSTTENTTWSSDILNFSGMGTNIVIPKLENKGTEPYTITFTAVTANGCANTATITVNPEPSVSTSTNFIVCEYDAVEFTINSTMSGTTIDWELSNDVPPSNPTYGTGLDTIAINKTGLAPGNYTYRITGTKDGCTSSEVTVAVTVN